MLQSTEVDGVPVFWAPGDGVLRASLWFRAGMVDESLPTRGWLHLIEHLALHGRDSVRVPVNGHVSLLYSSFDVEGEPEDVVAFLRDVCRWLAEPDFKDLEHERRVLRAESETRGGGGLTGGHLLWRYGARGAGLGGYDELGLYTAEPDGLRALAGWAYAQGNAVLALSGPPPAGLELPLQPGPRVLPAPARPCDQPTPAGFVGRQNTIALSGTIARTTAATTMLRALQRDLQRGLRHGAGVGYSAWSSYEPVDADHAMLTAGMDVLAEAVPTVVDQSTAVLRRLRDRGPDPTELRDDLNQQIRQYASHPINEWLPFLAARDVLTGRPVTTSADELVAETEAVTVADVRQAAHGLWRDLLVSVDRAGAGSPQLTWLDGPPAAGKQPSGQRFRPVGSPVAKGELTVGRTEIHRQAEDAAISAQYDDLAAMVAYPDGGRLLIRQDGYQVTVEPTMWQKGQQAVALLDSAVARPLRVQLPERAPEEIPKSSVRTRDKVQYWGNRPIVWAPFLVLCLLGVVLALATEEIAAQASKFVVMGAIVGLVSYVKHRRDGGSPT
ncbi:hypothetical protein [Kribbella sp. NPDC051770]|uniref:hypothetical protein n=1 Tax=Kribbella sp. NPDC051770 TaxID=3155413 RepID=UPI00344ADF51